LRRRTSRRIAKAKYKEDTEKDFVNSFSDFSNNSETTKLEKIKMQNKIRARKSRERKKKYTENLEQKVDILEKQVKYLTLELDKYKKIALRKGRFFLSQFYGFR
jgi:polyhydroxyalkanoate synthesis regulator phasin